MCSTTKFCPRCKQTKSTDEFSKNKARMTGGRDGLASYCKQCVREYGKERKYDKIRWENNRDKESKRHRDFVSRNKESQLSRYRENARRYRAENKASVNATNRSRSKFNFVPSWANKSAMKVIYEKAALWSEILGCKIEVDHIVPLRGKTVCGLHCEHNLQLLEKTLNFEKRNFTWPDKP